MRLGSEFASILPLPLATYIRLWGEIRSGQARSHYTRVMYEPERAVARRPPRSGSLTAFFHVIFQCKS